MPSSRLVPGRFPQQGVSPIADRIRERRGARGLTPLDGTLLHVPPVADGWNSLLGAIRAKGKLPGDVRELIILRVAAINGAAFEWIHHEHVGRDHGLTTSQLYLIRDTSALPSRSNTTLSPLQSAALAFAHHSTQSVKVPPDVTQALKDALREISTLEDDVQDFLVEAAAIAASYNMVSRFLVSLDVAAMSDNVVPWPADRKEHKVPLADDDGHIHVVTYTTHPGAPWIICCNSLLTNIGMWEWVLPYLLGPQEGKGDKLFLGQYKTYNILLHDQRGHGSSTTNASAKCTILTLANDISHILEYLKIPTPIHSVIGVSQGGATALAFGASYANTVRSVVACDTSARTPAGNKQAWSERIELASRGGVDDEGVGKNMRELGQVTVERWFPGQSPCAPGGKEEGIVHRRTRSEVIMESMVMKTTLDGFKLGAGALMEYDLYESTCPITACTVPTLLVAGSLDGNGKVAEGMMNLQNTWREKGGQVEFKLIVGAGHLPMVDKTEDWWKVLKQFLQQV
ncbi:alpha/beta-hydrolase [Marasmius fiardii PR-910]|nr:alpha/beta-hydrolase [Marasmius fiardii PR-910]